jgi:hypothetical protein
VNACDHRTYRLRVAGHLDDRWAGWFDGLTITSYDDGTCTLTGEVADQAQLHGILARLRDVGVTLVSLSALDDDQDGGAGAGVSAPSADRARDHDAPPHDGC